VRHDVGDDAWSGELGLQIGQVLTLVRGEARDVDEADNVLGDASGGDERAAVGNTRVYATLDKPSFVFLST
jgi:hypothetical protein